jgi:hypothetical protein
MSLQSERILTQRATVRPNIALEPTARYYR